MENNIKLHLNFSGRQLEIEACPNSNGKDLKNLIQAKGANVAFVNKKLLLDGKEISDETTIAEVNAQNGSQLEIINN